MSDSPDRHPLLGLRSKSSYGSLKDPLLKRTSPSENRQNFAGVENEPSPIINRDKRSSTIDEFNLSEQAVDSKLSHAAKALRTGRQRKKTAARTKGGEFQARRKKRRVYFCCISNDIDVERLADEFQEAKFGMKGKMYDEVLHLYMTDEQGNSTFNGESLSRLVSAESATSNASAVESVTEIDIKSPPQASTMRKSASSNVNPFALMDPLVTLSTSPTPGPGVGILVQNGALGSSAMRRTNTFEVSYSSNIVVEEEEAHKLFEQQQLAAQTGSGNITDHETDDYNETGGGIGGGARNLRNRKFLSLPEDDEANVSPTYDNQCNPLSNDFLGHLNVTQAEHIELTAGGGKAAFDALLLTGQAPTETSREVFVFGFGAAVFWGLAKHEVQELLSFLTGFIEKPLSREEFEAGEDDMAFVTSYEPGAQEITIANDVITLNALSSVKDRLAVSFAIAQSAVLTIFESRVERKIEEYKYIPEKLAESGKVKLSPKQLGIMIGEIFVMQHDVNLHSEILDLPDYFWKENRVEPLYRMTMGYMEMLPRIAVLNKRLDLLRELLRVLQQQHENAHSVKLEWIVIWLIVISCVLEMWDIVKDVFGLTEVISKEVTR